MITTDDKVRTVHKSEVGDTAKFHIDPENIGHITAILREMYPDPPLAVVREYCANALDAHQQVGKLDVPLVITPPTHVAPVFRVRDVGPGLSVADTKKLLLGYGASGDHKRQSNEQIGGFGIGCKCAFAISDQFSYTVYHGGFKREWTCYLDETDIGQAAMLSEEPCGDETGVDVQIPIKSELVNTFRDRIQKAYICYPTQPKITEPGFQLKPPSTVSASGTISVNCPDGLGNETTDVEWRLHATPTVYNGYNQGQVGQSLAVMGALSYPIDVTGQLARHAPASNTDRWNAMMGALPWLSFRLPIGWVQVAPTRESLQYSKKTVSRLTALFDLVSSPEFRMRLEENRVNHLTSGKSTVGAWLAARDVLTTAWPLSKIKGSAQAQDAKLVGMLTACGLGMNVDAEDTKSGVVELRVPKSIGRVIPARTTIRSDSHYRRGTVCNILERYVNPNLGHHNGYLHSAASAIGQATPAILIISTTDVFDTFTSSNDLDDTTRDPIRKLACRVAERFIVEHGANLATLNVNFWVLKLVAGKEDECMKALLDLRWIKDGTVELYSDTELPPSEHPEYFSLEAYRKFTQSGYARSRGPSVNYAQHAKKFVVFDPKAKFDPSRRSSAWSPALAKDVVAALKESKPIVYTTIRKFQFADFTGYDNDFQDLKVMVPSLIKHGLLPASGLYGVREDDVKTLPAGAVKIHEYVSSRIDAAIDSGALTEYAAELCLAFGAERTAEPSWKVMTRLMSLAGALPDGYSPRVKVLKAITAGWKKELRAAVTGPAREIALYLMDAGAHWRAVCQGRGPHGPETVHFRVFGKLGTGATGPSLLGNTAKAHVRPDKAVTDVMREMGTWKSSLRNHFASDPTGLSCCSSPWEFLQVWCSVRVSKDIAKIFTALPFTAGSLMACLPLSALAERLDETVVRRHFAGLWEAMKQSKETRVACSKTMVAWDEITTRKELCAAEQRP